MKIPKASVIFFLLVPAIIWQANKIMETCAADFKENRFTISEAEPCTGDYRSFLIDVCLFAALSCLFTTIFLVWRANRELRSFSLFDDKK